MIGFRGKKLILDECEPSRREALPSRREATPCDDVVGSQKYSTDDHDCAPLEVPQASEFAHGQCCKMMGRAVYDTDNPIGKQCSFWHTRKSVLDDAV